MIYQPVIVGSGYTYVSHMLRAVVQMNGTNSGHTYAFISKYVSCNFSVIRLKVEQPMSRCVTDRNDACTS